MISLENAISPLSLRTWLPIVALFISLAGCSDPPQAAQPTTQKSPRPAVTLRVVVCDDLGLTEAIKLLRGEWAERTGGSLEVVGEKFMTQETKPDEPADLYVFPTRLLGELIEQKRLRPVNKKTLASKSLQINDIFPLVRDVEMRHAGETYGVALSCQPLLLGFPENYQPEYPLALRLIAMAAAYSDADDRETLLFDPVSMKPQLSTKPFVRALQEIAIELATSSEKEPSHAEPFAVTERYNRALDRWEPMEPKLAQVTLLTGGGRMASVAAASRNSTSAFQLLQWLASSKVSTQLARKSPATFPCRISQIQTATKWFPEQWPQARAQQAAQLTQTAMNREAYYLIPRIRHVDRYLSALEEAIRNAHEAELSPVATLKEASKQWATLTNEIGREEQRSAYQQQLD